MLNVAITGGAGFIGISALDSFLRSGFRVAILDTARRLSRAGRHLCGATAIRSDNLSIHEIARHLDGVDVLVHLAWSSQPANSMSEMAEDANRNIVGSIELFGQAALHGVPKIVFASSGGTVYGNTHSVPISEGRLLNPVSAYGVSKAAVERYLQLICFHHNLAGVSLRIGNPYGPYQLMGTGLPIGVIARFIRCIRNGEPLTIYGDGKVVRDYIWIDDTVNALVAAVSSEIPSGEYNIGSGVGYSVNAIADLLEAHLGQIPHRAYISHRSFDAEKIVLDITKFKIASGWRPLVDIPEGISLMCKGIESGL